MYKKLFAATFVLATMAGCSNTTVQNPVDYVTYRNEPLVKQVENGMTRQQVLTIGGEPSSTIAVSYKHLRAHETPYMISYAAFCLEKKTQRFPALAARSFRPAYRWLSHPVRALRCPLVGH
ncbi:outer membrane protein assembly factor BamE domain-containing protein [Pseudomonas syringae]|uniref:outer membrane protein assembly factor BamE domain-containing protein n=1 Tax=Pseudomonas syringae TaxID=317 RepID=UPI003AF3BC60